MKILSEDKLAIVQKLISTFKMRPMLCNSDKSPKGKWADSVPLTAEEVVNLADSGAFIGYRIGEGTILLDLDNDEMSSADKFNKLCEAYPDARKALLHRTPNGKHLIFRTEVPVGQTQGTMCKLGFKIDTRVPASENNQGGYAIMYPSENGKRAFVGEEINTVKDINELPLYPAELLLPIKEVKTVKQATKAIKPTTDATKCSIIEYLIANPESLSSLEAGKGNGHRYIFQLLSMLFQYPMADRKDKYAALVSALTVAKVDSVHICSLENLEETGKTPSCGSMVEYCKLAGIESFDLCRNCSIRKSHVKEVKNGEININFDAIKTYSEFKAFVANYYYNIPIESPNSVIRAEIVRRMIKQYGFTTSGSSMLVNTELPQLKELVKSDKQYLKTMFVKDFPVLSADKASEAIAKEIITKVYDPEVLFSITSKINDQHAILMSDNKVLDYKLRIRDISADDIFINRLNSCYDANATLSDEHKAIIDNAINAYSNEYIYNIMGLVMTSIIPGQDRQMFLGLVGSALDEFGVEQNAGFGKTAFMNMMITLIGRENNAKTVKIEEFDKRFIDPSFPSLMLLYIDEVNNKQAALDAMNAMKIFVNQKNPIQMEAKGVQNRSTYTNNAGIVLSTNSPSSFLNKSDQGALRRFQPCIFTRQFSTIENKAEKEALSDNFMSAMSLLQTDKNARNYLFTKIVDFMRECMNNGVDMVPEAFNLKKESLLANNREESIFDIFDEYLGFRFDVSGKDRMTSARIRNKFIQLGLGKLIPESPQYFSKMLVKYIKLNGAEDFIEVAHNQNFYKCFIVEEFGKPKKTYTNIHTAIETLNVYKSNHPELGNKSDNIISMATAQPSSFKSTYGTNEPDPFDIVFGEQSIAPLA